MRGFHDAASAGASREGGDAAGGRARRRRRAGQTVARAREIAPTPSKRVASARARLSHARAEALWRDASRQLLAQRVGGSARRRTSAATVAKFPLWLVCSASTVGPRATNA